jgi:hypothetical protein
VLPLVPNHRKVTDLAEQPVFWLGGSPGKNKTNERAAPEAERYEPALRDACEACGYDVDEFVAALGGFGGWLAHLERGGTQYRVFWSGKTKRLSFEEAKPHGWEVLRATEQEDAGLPGFVDGVKALLTDQQSGS